MWYYFISSGVFSRPFDDTPLFAAYSGRGVSRNNVDHVGLRTFGPTPPGMYRALAPRDHPRLGPVAIPLEPHRSTDTKGRSGFFIHGDNRTNDASTGCIIVQRSARLLVAPGDIVVVFP